MLGTKRLIPKGCELGTTLIWLNQSIQKAWKNPGSNCGYETVILFLLETYLILDF